jgi:hypothetical protein
MEESIKQFEKDLKVHLEHIFNASTKDDEIEKLSETEKSVLEYVKKYIENSNLTFKDLYQTIQNTLDAFAKSKINYSAHPRGKKTEI